MKKKYNLVITHSFPTNSIILKGLVDFLSEYFNVYFIDLPGFRNLVTPLKQISIDGYAEYMEKEIRKINLDKYILGSMSFSHCVVSKMKVDECCKSVIAIEPFINKKVFKIKKYKLIYYQLLTNIIKRLNIYDYIWKKNYLGIFLKFADKEVLEVIINEIDPKTFIDTANIIFSFSGEYWLNKPYILIMNKNDNKISYKEVTSLFKKNVDDLLIVDTDIKHFPDDMSLNYFKQQLNSRSINSIFKWLEKRY